MDQAMRRVNKKMKISEKKSSHWAGQESSLLVKRLESYMEQ